MALINCPECNNQISSDAKVCPHCGKKIKKTTGKMKKGYLTLISVILIILALGCFGGGFVIRNLEEYRLYQDIIERHELDSEKDFVQGAQREIDEYNKKIMILNICGAVFIVGGIATVFIQKKSKE